MKAIKINPNEQTIVLLDLARNTDDIRPLISADCKSVDKKLTWDNSAFYADEDLYYRPNSKSCGFRLHGAVFLGTTIVIGRGTQGYEYSDSNIEVARINSSLEWIAEDEALQEITQQIEKLSNGYLESVKFLSEVPYNETNRDTIQNFLIFYITKIIHNKIPIDITTGMIALERELEIETTNLTQNTTENEKNWHRHERLKQRIKGLRSKLEYLQAAVKKK